MSKILLVENEARTRAIIVKYLNSSGNNYSAANTGVEGLSLLEKSHFDLVITDVIMPLMDSNRFIERIAKLPDPPLVIAITNHIWNITPHPIVKEIMLKPVRVSVLNVLLHSYLNEEV